MAPGGAPSLPLRLEELQRVGRLSSPPFATVPPSCQAPVEGLLDAAGEMKSVVLLGFTRDGCHLVSYSTQPVVAADGVEGYCLQLWSYRQGERCRRLCSVPLFRTQPYLDSLEDEEDFMGGADDMLLSVAEAPDSSLLVVHGRSSDPADANSRDSHLPNFLTIMPGPLHTGAAQLQVAHLSYNTTFPHAPFNPFHFLTSLEAGCTGSAGQAGPSSSDRWLDVGTLAVALYTGDGVRYVHAAASRQAAMPASLAPSILSSQGEDEDDSSASRFPSPEPMVGVASAAASPPWAAPAGQRTPVQPPPSASIPQHFQQQQQQQQRGSVSPAASRSPAASPSPRSSPWQRQGRLPRPPHRYRQERSLAAPAGSGECELGVQFTVVPCTHAGGRVSMHSMQQQRLMASNGTASGDGCSHSGGSSSSRSLAAVSLIMAPQQLDLETCLFAALRQQGLPPSALVDYAAAPVQACMWQEQEGLLVLAVLRLVRSAQRSLGDPGIGGGQAAAGQRPQQQQQQAPAHRSACVLLHAAACGGAGELVEWLEPPYPWHDDLSAFLVQQTAFAGLAFEKAPAFFADFLAKRYGSGPPPRSRLPLVLTNRSVLGSGASLPHIVHPWLPQAILGYGGSSRSGAAA